MSRLMPGTAANWASVRNLPPSVAEPGARVRAATIHPAATHADLLQDRLQQRRWRKVGIDLHAVVFKSDGDVLPTDKDVTIPTVDFPAARAVDTEAINPFEDSAVSGSLGDRRRPQVIRDPDLAAPDHDHAVRDQRQQRQHPEDDQNGKAARAPVHGTGSP